MLKIERGLSIYDRKQFRSAGTQLCSTVFKDARIDRSAGSCRDEEGFGNETQTI